MLRPYYLIVLSLSSSIFRQNGFLCNNLELIWGIVPLRLPVFNQKTLRCNNRCFLLFVHGKLIFHMILIFFVMNSLGKSISENCIALLCNIMRFRPKGDPIRGHFYFSSIFIQILQNDHLNGLLSQKKKMVFYFNKGYKGDPNSEISHI